MKRYYLLFIAIPAFILMSFQAKKTTFSNFTGFAQGSTYSIVYENKVNIDPVDMRQRIDKILTDFDNSLSLYNKTSVLSRINRNEDISVDDYFTEAFNRSAQISKLTDGAFDITVGPLVKAWGFGPDGHKSFTEVRRDSLLRLVGMSKVSLVNGHVIKSDPHMYLDFNAIAQGLSVDIVCRYLDGLGIKNYLVEIGGEVRAKGKKEGNLWRIGIDRPEDNILPGQDLEAIIKISNQALATSGNYRKFYIENGVKYSHEIDPKSGYPARNTLLSVSAIANDCTTADGIATAFMVMGKDKTIAFLKNHPEYEAYLIYSGPDGSFKTWVSDRLKNELMENDEKK